MFGWFKKRTPPARSPRPRHPPLELNTPPFPRLRRREFRWEGRTELESLSEIALSWEGAKGPSVALDVDDSSRVPSPEQAAAFQHLIDNERAVVGAALAAILRYCMQHRDELLSGYDEEDSVGLLPEGHDVRDLISRIGEPAMHVLENHKDGIAYLGFCFECVWDVEHGVGVMTHKGRVIDVGMADHGFSLVNMPPE